MSGQSSFNADTLQAILAHEMTDSGKVKRLLSIAISFKPGDVAREFYYANEALDLSLKANWDAGAMQADALLGDCFDYIKDYRDAINCLNKAIVLAQKLNRPLDEAKCTQLVLHSYHILDKMDSVLYCQQKIIDIVQKYGSREELCNQMQAYGLFLSEAGMYPASVAWLNKALKLAGEYFAGDKRKNKTADILNILAGSYLKVNREDSALRALRIAAGLVMQTGNHYEYTYINSTFCDVYAEFRNYDSAIIYGERTVKMGEASGNLDLQQYYCKVLSHVYEARGNMLKALYYHKRHDSLVGIINNSQKAIDQAVALSQTDIQLQSEKAKRDKAALDAVRREQEIALIAALISIIILVAVTIYVYRNLKQKQNANMIIGAQAANLQEQNQVIDKALREKEELLKETHHRVKNNLQLISSLLELQSASYDDDHIKEALRTAQRRVQSIAAVHNKLYGTDDTAQIDLHAFTDDLFFQLNNAFGSGHGRVSFENAIPATMFPLNIIVLLGLVLNELITNSFKHAFNDGTGGLITVSLEFTGTMYTLKYRDNGKGMPEERFTSDSGSLGLYLVKRLSRQLKGMVTYKNDNGSIFTIIFPDAGS